AGLAGGRVRPVAAKAVVEQDGPDVAIVGKRRGRSAAGSGSQQQGGGNSESAGLAGRHGVGGKPGLVLRGDGAWLCSGKTGKVGGRKEGRPAGRGAGAGEKYEAVMFESWNNLNWVESGRFFKIRSAGVVFF